MLLFVAQRFGDVINMFVGMWLVPKYVPQEELGAVLPLAQTASFLALPLSIVSIPFMKFITVFVDGGELGRAKAFVRDVFLAAVALTLLSIAFAYFMLPVVFSRLHVGIGSLGFLVVAVSVLSSTSAIFGYAVQGFRMYSTTLWIQVLQAPLRLVLMLVTMPFRALSGYMIGQTAGPIVQISAALLACRRMFGKKVAPEPYWNDYGRAIIRYVVPFAIWSIVGSLSNFTDMLVIRHRLSEADSAGYYILTRFTDIASYVGLAVSGFLFPMVASVSDADKDGRRMFFQSFAGSLFGGGVIVVLLSIFGEWILGLIPVWSKYSDMASIFPLIGATTVVWGVNTCFITYETAQGRFGFLWYAVPILLLKSVFLYGVTGYAFFEGCVPPSVMSVISWMDPCRLSFVSNVLLAGQLMLLVMFLANRLYRDFPYLRLPHAHNRI